jgi:hypothetical protein
MAKMVAQLALLQAATVPPPPPAVLPPLAFDDLSADEDDDDEGAVAVVATAMCRATVTAFRLPPQTTSTKCVGFSPQLHPLIRLQTLQLLIKRVVKELIAAHADVLPSSPAFAELFSTAVRPHLLSASDIPDGTMVFIRRRTTDTHSLHLKILFVHTASMLAIVRSTSNCPRFPSSPPRPTKPLSRLWPRASSGSALETCDFIVEYLLLVYYTVF